MFGKRNPGFATESNRSSRSPYRDPYALHRSSSRPNVAPIDCFKPTHDIFNSKNREPNPTQYQSAKTLNFTDTADHLRICPRQYPTIPDNIELDLMPRSYSTPRLKSYKAKGSLQEHYPDLIVRGRDPSMNNVGEFINDPKRKGLRRIDARSMSSCDTRKDLEKPAYRFFVEPSTPQSLSATNSPTKISKAFKAIYELNNEGRQCFGTTNAAHEEKTQTFFTSIINTNDAAGGVGTVHKKFIVKNQGKRLYDPWKSFQMKRHASVCSVSASDISQFEKADKMIESYMPLQNLKLRHNQGARTNYVQEIIRKSQVPREESPKTQKGTETMNASLNLGASPTGSESKYVPWSKTPTNKSKLLQIKSIPLSASKCDKTFSDHSPTVYTHTARSEHATRFTPTPRGRKTEATTPSAFNTSRIQQGGATPTKGSQTQIKSWQNDSPSSGAKLRTNNPVRSSNTGFYGQGVKVSPNLKRGYFSSKK